MNDKALIGQAMSAYGLDGTPYARRELDPVNNDTDLDLVSPVDGWQQVDEVSDFLVERAAAKQHAMVVVAGGSGTGRTSMARYLIRKWADGRSTNQGDKFDRSKLIVASGHIDENDDEEELLKWVLAVRPLVLAKRVPTNQQTETAFDTLLHSKPTAMAAGLQITLLKLVTHLHSLDWALAGIIEDIASARLLTLAANTFKHIDSLVVLTVQDTKANRDAVLSNVGALDGEASRVMRLGELDGAEAGQVVLHRWHRSSDPAVPLPFEGDAVANGFNGRRRPVARVLRLMEHVLTMKVAANPPARWPDSAQLSLSEEQVAHMITVSDNALVSGR